MHPVPFGLIAAVHDPTSEEGAVGGSGNSEIWTGSGLGAGGFSGSFAMELFRLERSRTCGVLGAALAFALEPAIFCASMSGAMMLVTQAAATAGANREHTIRSFMF